MRIEAPCTAQIPQLRALWKDAFDDTDAFLDDFFGTAFSSERAMCVTENGTLAAALYWFDCRLAGGRVAYIYAVATAKDYRGRGICRALMEETHRCLRQRGYRGAVLVPENAGLLAMYRKMGYEICGYVREFCCRAKVGDRCFSRIGKHEYAALRQRYLPRGGVMQERENLDFLETQASMYKGENCVFAAYRIGDRLICRELLGDASAAPQIVNALGCGEGVFRVPGGSNDIPFAMYHAPDNAAPPTYFGLAFD